MLKAFRMDRFRFNNQLFDMSTNKEEEVPIVEETPLVGVVDVNPENIDATRERIELNVLSQLADGHEVGVVVNGSGRRQTQTVECPVRFHRDGSIDLSRLIVGIEGEHPAATPFVQLIVEGVIEWMTADADGHH